MGQGAEERNPNEDTRRTSYRCETECPKGLGQIDIELVLRISHKVAGGSDISWEPRVGDMGKQVGKDFPIEPDWLS